jgi:hypothetical protein
MRACSRLVLVLWAAAVVAVAASAQPAPPGRLALVLEAEAVVAAGLTAGGDAVFFGLNYELGGDGMVTLRRFSEIEAADSAGEARFELGRAVAPQSLWVVVDLQTGAVEAASPAGFRLQRANFRGRGPRRRADGRGVVEDYRGFVEMLVVRPGAGSTWSAWALSAGDGSPNDADETIDGRLEAALDRMEPLGTSGPPPDELRRDDVVVLFDPDGMEMVLALVGTGNGQGGER